MATLEDKLLGDKLEYYCSSSEDEGADEDNDNGDEAAEAKQSSKGGGLKMERNPTLSKNVSHWTGTSQNTGPKGVVQDWQLYKQLEAQRREEEETRRLELMKKLSITTSTRREDEQRQKDEELEAELAELMNDDFLQQFQKQRMAEMLQQCGGQNKVFGKCFHIKSRAEFLDAVEKEDKNITIVIHIYDNILSCTLMNKCFDSLAEQYTNVKFCKIASATAGMSGEFKSKGVPAILVYKGNQLIGNFVRVTDELSDDFFPSDVESFLVENGMIFEKTSLS